MFWKETENTKLQKAMRQVGADPSEVKAWFRTLEKMRKSAPVIRKEYEEAYNATEQLVRILEKMENTLKGAGGVLSEQEHALIRDCKKSIRQLAGKCDHSFVVSPEDQEFHKTFQMLLTLEPGRESNAEKTLILQSEIENLLAMARESLNRESPSLVWLCYYQVNRSGRSLEKLPPQERLAKIRRVYQNEFVDRMRTTLADCIQEAYRLREASGRLGPGMEILLDKDPETSGTGLSMNRTRADFERQAEAFLVELCEME